MSDRVDWSRFVASDEARDEFCRQLLVRATLDAVRSVVGQRRTVVEAVAHEVERVPEAMSRDGAPAELVLFVAELLRRGRPVIAERVSELIAAGSSAPGLGRRKSRREAAKPSREVA